VHPVFTVLMEWLATEIEPIRKATSGRLNVTYARCSDAQLVTMKRDAWNAAQREHLGSTRTEIKHQAPALWTWLYRHDHDWLKANEVPVQIIGQFRAQHSIPSAVLERIASNRLDYRCCANGLTPLSSAYQTRISYGMSVVAFTQAAAVLNGDGIAAQLPARREVFVSRRIERARALLAAADAPVNASNVYRKAALSVNTIKKHSIY
jgi:hypothetical protein